MISHRRSGKMDEDIQRAIKVSLNQPDPGAGSGGIEEAAFMGLPQVETMEYQEQIRLAMERSSREQEIRRIKEKADEDHAIRKAIEASIKDTKDPQQQDVDHYKKQFLQTLSQRRTSPTTPTKQFKKRIKSNASPPPGSSDFGGIQEEEELSLAIQRSKQDHIRERGGGGTNQPTVMNQYQPVVFDPSIVSEEVQLQLAIELSKGDMTSTAAMGPARPVSPPVSLVRPGTPPYVKAATTKISFGGSCPRVDLRTIAPDVECKRKKGERRPIVVDGCNVGYQYSRNNCFSAKGLWIVYQYFVEKGWLKDEIVMFVKRPPMTADDEVICDQLYQLGVLQWTPKRHVGASRIVCDDDNMILDYAKTSGGVVISMDQFRDSYEKFPEFRETIKHRVLQFNFINDKIIFSRFPLGMGGVTLQQFLTFQ